MKPYQSRHAATVILVRPAAEAGFEVFMTRRPADMDFLGGMYVFPGGTVGQKDWSEEMLERCSGLTREQARNILGAHLSPEVALGHWVAGIRELFEEVGVMLCVTAQGRSPALEGIEGREILTRRRTSLVAGSLEFADLLKTDGLFCHAGVLAYFCHWLTPEEFPTRFNTRFYLAALPPGQTPLPTSEEVAHSLWITPETALDLCRRGELPVIFPTYACLRTLADFDSIQALFKEYQLNPNLASL